AKDATINVTASANGGYMQIVSTWGPADTSEDSTHPGAPTAHNYWYVKLDAKACYNLSPYSAFQFDLKGPAGTNFGITLTQKSANCSTRLVDSVYKNLTDYVTMDGTKKTVTLPVKDFSTNLLGAGFDLVHLKDFTSTATAG
ncbi:hypothetical protein HDV03_004905, partial [Kappamyces sp. JEL0829]